MNKIPLKNQLTSLVFLTLLCASCTKAPGDGGSASISGKVDLEVRASVEFAITAQYEEPAQDQEVYIIYGDNTSPDDRVRTNFDGEYEFQNLRPGNYTVYTYSKDTTNYGASLSGERDMEVVQEVSIADRKQEIIDINFMIYDEL